MRHPTRLLRLLPLLWLLSCDDASAPTRVMLTIAAQPGVQARAKQLRITIYGVANGTSTLVRDGNTSPIAANFPYVIELSPQNDEANRSYRVEVVALQDQLSIAYASLSSGYVAHQTRYLTLTLDDACLDKPSCGTDLTCPRGRVRAGGDRFRRGAHAPRAGQRARRGSGRRGRRVADHSRCVHGCRRAASWPAVRDRCPDASSRLRCRLRCRGRRRRPWRTRRRLPAVQRPTHGHLARHLDSRPDRALG